MTFAIKGGPELMALLDQLPAKLATNVVRGGLRAGAKVIQTEARLLVRAESGLTRKSIKIDTGARDGRITATIKTRGKHAYLAPMLEYGIAPHFITIADADRGALGVQSQSVKTINKMTKRGSLVINGKFVGPSVHHPGVMAHPFMRPALDAKAKDAVNAVGQYIAARLRIGNLSAPVLASEDDE